MVSDLETKIRNLDDESVSIVDAAKIISDKIGSNFETTRAYLRAKRKKHDSRTNLLNRFTVKGGHNSRKDYVDVLAHNRGFPSRSELVRSKYNGFNTYEKFIKYEDKLADQKFYDLHETLSNEDLDNIGVEDRTQDKQEISHQVNKLIDTLSVRERTIIIDRFSSGKTLQGIATEFGVTKQRIKQIELKAFEKLQPKAINKGLQKYLTAY